MKTLRSHIILYDAECPMCKVYTSAFTQTGMLDSNGRTPYQNMPANLYPYVDQQRAVNEIALVSTETGEVTYGIDSLFKVIGNACPLFILLFRLRPFAWTMRKLYAFISYNRKVIIPPPAGTQKSPQPAFSLKHRIAYILVAAILSGLVFTRFGKHIPTLQPYPALLFIGFLSLLTVTSLPASARPKHPAPNQSPRGNAIPIQNPRSTGNALAVKTPRALQNWNCAGNIATILLASTLLLLPGFFLPLPHIYLTITLILALIEHFRRIRLQALA